MMCTCRLYVYADCSALIMSIIHVLRCTVDTHMYMYSVLHVATTWKLFHHTCKITYIMYSSLCTCRQYRYVHVYVNTFHCIQTVPPRMDIPECTVQVQCYVFCTLQCSMHQRDWDGGGRVTTSEKLDHG